MRSVGIFESDTFDDDDEFDDDEADLSVKTFLLQLLLTLLLLLLLLLGLHVRRLQIGDTFDGINASSCIEWRLHMDTIGGLLLGIFIVSASDTTAAEVTVLAASKLLVFKTGLYFSDCDSYSDFERFDSLRFSEPSVDLSHGAMEMGGFVTKRELFMFLASTSTFPSLFTVLVFDRRFSFDSNSLIINLTFGTYCCSRFDVSSKWNT